MADVEKFRHGKDNLLLKNLVFVARTIMTACHFYLQQIVLS